MISGVWFLDTIFKYYDGTKSYSHKVNLIDEMENRKKNLAVGEA